MTTLPTRRELVLRKINDEGELQYEFLAKTRLPTDDLELAATFKSKLGVQVFMKPMFGEEEGRWGWLPVFKDEVAIEPKKFEAPFDLLVPDPFAAVREVYRLHHVYCDKVESWLRRAGVDMSQTSRPEAKITITGPKWAGLYTSNDHACHYPIAYAMMHLGDTGEARSLHEDYRLTVAHEVVHAYQMPFSGRAHVGHGNDFYALMRHAAGEPVNAHTHAHDWQEAARLAESLKRYWQVARQSGATASLPCKVETKGRKRTNAIR